MNIIEKRKKQLIGIAIAIFALSLALLAGGIVLIIFSAKAIGTITLFRVILRIVIGALLILIGLCSFGYFVAFAATGGAIVATKGSLKEDNLAMGTVGVKKCQSCGCELDDDVKFCPSCASPQSQTKQCPACNATCAIDASNCHECGKEF